MAPTTTHSRFLWLLNKSMNRITSQIARSGHGPFSLIRHVGRKSGRTFETPVILAEVPEGFIAELLLGHRDATVTRVVYVHEIADARRRHMRRSRMTAEYTGALRIALRSKSDEGSG